MLHVLQTGYTDHSLSYMVIRSDFHHLPDDRGHIWYEHLDLGFLVARIVFRLASARLNFGGTTADLYYVAGPLLT